MARKPKVHHVNYLGMDGTGQTVKDAKADAAQKIEAAMEGSYTPIVLTAGGETIICYREPTYGWSYSFVRNGELSGSSIMGDRSRTYTERSARRHLGGIATDWRTCFGPDDVDSIVLDPADRKDIAEGCSWQRKYHAAREAGLDDDNARKFIGGFTQLMSQPVPAALACA
jgi:hypothetical protein